MTNDPLEVLLKSPDEIAQMRKNGELLPVPSPRIPLDDKNTEDMSDAELNLSLAVACNAKEITSDDFKEAVGQDFYSFWNENNKACLAAWRDRAVRAKHEKKSPLHIRCQFSNQGLIELRQHGRQRYGHIIGYSRTGGVHVLWDGRNVPQTYAKEFIATGNVD